MRKIKAFLKTCGMNEVYETTYPAKFWHEIFADRAVVYFLLNGGNIIYIGFTENIVQRVGFHEGKRVFDSIILAPCKNKEQATRAERDCITYFKPVNTSKDNPIVIDPEFNVEVDDKINYIMWMDRKSIMGFIAAWEMEHGAISKTKIGDPKQSKAA